LRISCFDFPQRLRINASRKARVFGIRAPYTSILIGKDGLVVKKLILTVVAGMILASIGCGPATTKSASSGGTTGTGAMGTGK